MQRNHGGGESNLSCRCWREPAPDLIRGRTAVALGEIGLARIILRRGADPIALAAIASRSLRFHGTLPFHGSADRRAIATTNGAPSKAVSTPKGSGCDSGRTSGASRTSRSAVSNSDAPASKDAGSSTAGR